MASTNRVRVIALATLWVATLFSVSTPVLATLSSHDKAMILMGKDIQKNASIENLIGDFPNLNQGKIEAEQVLNAAKNSDPAMFGMDNTKENHQETTFLFLSNSLGQLGIREAVEFSSGLDDVAIIFRGMPDGMNITQTAEMLNAIIRGVDNPPAVYMNPTLFEEYGVDKVPTLVVTGQNHEDLNYELRVAGISDPSWILSRQEKGSKGDLGTQGPVEEIAEKDLIEVMKEKVATIDWEQKKNDATNNFWSNQKFIPVVTATQDRVRYIDPSFVVTRDIELPDGGFLAKQGQIVNPLEIRDFTQTLFIFDGTNAEEVKAVKKLVQSKLDAGERKTFKFITTKVDKELGWDSYESLSDDFEEPIFILTEDVKARFEVQFSPSIVESEGLKFKVSEVKP